jgi:hypothetical protein
MGAVISTYEKRLVLQAINIRCDLFFEVIVIKRARIKWK